MKSSFVSPQESPIKTNTLRSGPHRDWKAQSGDELKPLSSLVPTNYRKQSFPSAESRNNWRCLLVQQRARWCHGLVSLVEEVVNLYTAYICADWSLQSGLGCWKGAGIPFEWSWESWTNSTNDRNFIHITILSPARCLECFVYKRDYTDFENLTRALYNDLPKIIWLQPVFHLYCIPKPIGRNPCIPDNRTQALWTAQNNH